MELTKEQTQRVEYYLKVKQIDYIDIRLEIFDHIISDIEAKMESEKLDFETSFYAVTKKWNKHLKFSSSWIFGHMFSAPRMVIEKAKKSYFKWNLILIPILFITFLLVEKSNEFLTENIKNGINLLFQILTVFSFVVFAVLFLLKSRNKILTTYRFIITTQSLNLILGIIVLLDFRYFDKEGNLDSIKALMLVGFMYFNYIYFHFYKKHKEAIKKYKIS